MSSLTYEDALQRLRAAGQEHVLRFWPRLADAERRALLEQIGALDFELLQTLAPLARAAVVAPPAAFAPADVIAPHRDGDPSGELAAARKHGEELLHSGGAAMVLVAGGQATRLGFDAPKGMFPLGPASGRTLFEIHAHRLLAIARRTGIAPLWFVMTSPQNHEATLAYFTEKQYFGLPPRRVVLFPQATVPAFDAAGRLVLESPSALFRNPNGHGGVFAALGESGFLARCEDEGASQLFYWQVDNPLVRIGDPLFLGLHALRGAGMSSKVVAKRDAAEKVGVIGRADGRLACIEYSDLPPALRNAVDAQGRLVYGAGNIAIHAISTEFARGLLRRGAAHALPWHRAEKKVKSVAADGAAAEIAGVKFETFVFDALGESPASVTLEVLREDEFAPVKNAAGEDSPDSARAAVSHYYQRWMRKASVGVRAGAVEVHPQFAFDFDEFASQKHHLPPAAGDAYFVGAAHAPAHPGRPLRVGVVMGGTSAEREVSLRSGRAVLGSLDRARAAGTAIVIGADGRWSVGGRAAETPAAALQRLRRERIDVVFIALHGPGGEDGTLQGFFETAGVPFTGSGVEASALAMDKLASRALFERAGLRIAQAVDFFGFEWNDAAARAEIRARIAELRLPIFVKAPTQGSSFGVTRVGDASPAALDAAVASALRYGPRVLVEMGAAGVEITVPVLGNAAEPELRALPPVEIRPRGGAFFDTHEKYASSGAEEICPPKSIDADAIGRAQRIAIAAHRAIGCDGVSRTDMIVGDAGIVVLEVNTIPGLTERSLLPQSAAAAGMPFTELIHQLIDAALRLRAPHLLRRSL